ncbi:MAG: NTP transferase domain-containing protein [Bacteroidota bacterium]|nr:MAG: NTP transferase domain-containing protein [Bacteroidota bacterium]
MIQQEVSVYILAGGHSTRMGSDKGLVLLNQKPMIRYVLDLARFSESIYIVSNQPGYAEFGIPVLSDEIRISVRQEELIPCCAILVPGRILYWFVICPFKDADHSTSDREKCIL